MKNFGNLLASGQRSPEEKLLIKNLHETAPKETATPYMNSLLAIRQAAWEKYGSALAPKAMQDAMGIKVSQLQAALFSCNQVRYSNGVSALHLWHVIILDRIAEHLGVAFDLAPWRKIFPYLQQIDPKAIHIERFDSLKHIAPYGDKISLDTEQRNAIFNLCQEIKAHKPNDMTIDDLKETIVDEQFMLDARFQQFFLSKSPDRLISQYQRHYNPEPTCIFYASDALAILRMAELTGFGEENAKYGMRAIFLREEFPPFYWRPAACLRRATFQKGTAFSIEQSGLGNLEFNCDAELIECAPQHQYSDGVRIKKNTIITYSNKKYRAGCDLRLRVSETVDF